MITTTRTILLFGKKQARPLTLEHHSAVTGSSQRRLAKRTVLTPAIDLGNYRFRAVIDWIEFRLHFGQPTQVQHVQAVLRRFLPRNSFIAPEDKGPGDVFSICSIKVQEPASLVLIATIHKALVNTFGEAAGSRVTGIEVSVDATPKEPSDAARGLLLGAMQHTIWTDRDIWSDRMDRPRGSIGRGKSKNFTLSPDPDKDDTEVSRSVPENHKTPFIDGTVYLGAKESDVMIRVMDKLVDAQRPDGTRDVLADDRKRVRVEVTLKGKELEKVGITDIASLDRLNLQTFQKRYFQFMLPTFSKRDQPKTGADALHNTQQEWRAQTYLWSGIMALTAMDMASAKRRKAMAPGLQKILRTMNHTTARTWAGKRLASPVVSWAAMNSKVNVALRDLMKREATAKARALGV
jgi:hypothetical protein